MRVFITLACLLYSLAASAQTSTTPDPVAATMLEPTSEGRPLIERATALTNAVLGSRSPYHLSGSWQAPPAPVDGRTEITVYLVAPVADGGDFGIVVPFACNCIFAQPRVVLGKVAVYSGAMPQMLKIDEDQVVSFMLLHEVGHIKNGDAGKYADMRKVHSYTFEKSDQKEIEARADHFATEMLVAAAADMKDYRGWMAAMNTEVTLTKISWNLSAIRLLDNFGSSALCSKFVFADDGFTHPNFELRMLTANDLIVHTAETAELLASFDKCRKDTTSIVFPNK